MKVNKVYHKSVPTYNQVKQLMTIANTCLMSQCTRWSLTLTTNQTIERT